MDEIIKDEANEREIQRVRQQRLVRVIDNERVYPEWHKSHEQLAGAMVDNYECDACGKQVPKDEVRGGNFSAGVEGLFCHECRHGKDCKCIGDIVDNQHQHCATQLQFLANRAEELSSLLAGVTTERDGLRATNKQLLKALCSTAHQAADGSGLCWDAVDDRVFGHQAHCIKLRTVLNHAEQGEGN